MDYGIQHYNSEFKLSPLDYILRLGPRSLELESHILKCAKGVERTQFSNNTQMTPSSGSKNAVFENLAEPLDFSRSANGMSWEGSKMKPSRLLSAPADGRWNQKCLNKSSLTSHESTNLKSNSSSPCQSDVSVSDPCVTPDLNECARNAQISTHLNQQSNRHSMPSNPQLTCPAHGLSGELLNHGFSKNFWAQSGRFRDVSLSPPGIYPFSSDSTYLTTSTVGGNQFPGYGLLPTSPPDFLIKTGGCQDKKSPNDSDSFQDEAEEIVSRNSNLLPTSEAFSASAIQPPVSQVKRKFENISDDSQTENSRNGYQENQSSIASGSETDDKPSGDNNNSVTGAQSDARQRETTSVEQIRKKTNTYGDDEESYRKKREKNNAAAKRSRDRKKALEHNLKIVRDALKTKCFTLENNLNVLKDTFQVYQQEFAAMAIKIKRLDVELFSKEKSLNQTVCNECTTPIGK